MPSSTPPVVTRLVALSLASGPAAWIVAALLPATWVENGYSRGAGLWIAEGLGGATAAARGSLFELGVVGLAGLLLWTAARQWRRLGGGLRALGRLGVAATALGSAGYAVFLLLWGLHYKRLPLAASLGFDLSPPTDVEIQTLAERSLERVNLTRSQVAEDDAGVMRLRQSLDNTFIEARSLWVGVRGVLPGDPPFRPGRFAPPKPLRSSVLFSWAGVSGIYIPFTAEPNVNVDGPPIGVPFTALHELAHQRGVAREDEANFVAWRMTQRGDSADFAYSGAYFGFMYAYNTLVEVDPEAATALRAALHPGVERDIAARKRHRVLRSSKAEVVAQAANEAFIRSSGDARGVRSYDAVLQLMIADLRREQGPPSR